MALNFTTNIQTVEGCVLSNAYGRVSADDSFTGTHVTGHVDIYVSKQAFIDGLRPVKTRLIQDCREPYNREVNGTDILNIAHDGLIANLADQGVTATKDLS
jgi:hypothetical protein